MRKEASATQNLMNDQLKYLSKLKAFSQAEKAQYKATLLKVQSSRMRELVEGMPNRRASLGEIKQSSQDLAVAMPEPKRASKILLNERSGGDLLNVMLNTEGIEPFPNSKDYSLQSS